MPVMRLPKLLAHSAKASALPLVIKASIRIASFSPVIRVLLIGAQFLGATTLQSYGLALFVGLLSGAYSSIFIAAPVLSMMKEREERWVSIASRLAKRGETNQWYSALDAATMSTQMSVAASGQVSRGGGAGAAAQRSGGSKRSGPIRPGSGSRPGRGPATGGGGGKGAETAVMDRPPGGSAAASSAAGRQTPTQTQAQGQATQRPRKGKSKRKAAKKSALSKIAGMLGVKKAKKTKKKRK